MLLKERKLPKYGSTEYKRIQAEHAMKAAQDYNQMGKAAPEAILALRFGQEGNILSKLESGQGQREYFGDTLSNLKYKMAEGGLLDPMAQEATGSDMSAFEPVGDMSLLMPDPNALESESGAEDSTVGYLDGLRDILGEEDYMQLESAIADYPVVETVARMAVVTQDGEVDGLGGPKDDMVPARLSPGEFVFSKEAVDVIGVGTLEQMHEQAKEEAAMQGI